MTVSRRSLIRATQRLGIGVQAHLAGPAAAVAAAQIVGLLVALHRATVGLVAVGRAAHLAVPVVLAALVAAARVDRPVALVAPLAAVLALALVVPTRAKKQPDRLVGRLVDHLAALLAAPQAPRRALSLRA